ncbi:MAG: alpha/beta hydrolase [Acidimicrobiia bacterium]|nr:alpha/beta hydrolase [Acidimicrobiia bacterium]
MAARPIEARFPVVTPAGVIAVARWEGSGTPVLAVHATGFCKELWGPVAALLAPNPVVAPDQRGHGDSSTPPPPYDWWDLGRDLLEVVAADGPLRPVGLGHSSGAAALVMAELLRPGTFASLVLVEPIIFGVPAARMEDNPMTAAALRRKRAFASAGAVVKSFRSRGAFAGWTEEALGLYADHGFYPGPDGWVLKCRPETEAEFYRGATAHGAWARLHEIACPVVLAAGERSASHPREFLEAMRDRFRDARLEVVPGVGHFLPMERPEAVAALVAARLGRGGGGGSR